MYEVGQQIKTQHISGISVKKHLKNKAFEILSITLEKGAELPEHTSPKAAFLLVLDGAIDFTIEGNTYPIEALEDFSFPANRAHSVSARENSRILIIR